MTELFEAVGNMHMHTLYSDGEKWHAGIADDAIRAGLDFIIVTDHNVWVDGVEGYYENENGRVLLLAGEEVHNPRRQPQASHFLAYGAGRELSQFAANPQKYAPQYGGYCSWAASRNYVAPTDPAAWEIVDDKLYLNFSKLTHARWTIRARTNIAKGDANWPGLLAGA